jgi:CRISPR type I-E-associated protein CasB/Cse2
LGASLRLLRNKLSIGQESLDLRFSALLNTPHEDLTVPLRNMIQRIATADQRIPIDFYRLLDDLLHWNTDETRRRWARDYWQVADVEDLDSEPLDATVTPSI